MTKSGIMWVLSPERGEEAAVGRRRGTRPPASPDETSSLGQKENAPANVLSFSLRFLPTAVAPFALCACSRCIVLSQARRTRRRLFIRRGGRGGISRGILWRLLEMNMQVHYWGFLLKLARAARGFRLCISFYTQAPPPVVSRW